MATTVENLRQAIANVDAQILEITATPMPDYSLDGESESMSAHLRTLLEVRRQLLDQLLREEGPSEVWVQGTT